MTRNEAIIDRAKSGESYASIGRSTNLSRHYVRKVCEPVIGRRRKPTRPPKPPVFLDSIDRERVKRWYTEMVVSAEAIAAEFGCSPCTIRAILKENGVVIRPGRQKFPSSDIAKAVSLVRAGATYGEAAYETGLTRNAVAGAVDRARKKSQGGNNG